MSSKTPRIPNRARKSQCGFTLIELVLASLILVLVMGTVYTTMTMGMDVLKTGTRNLDLYQNARVGVGRLQQELRNAVSPASQWRPSTEYLPPGSEISALGNFVEEEEQSPILFLGSEESVEFTRKSYSDNQARDREDVGADSTFDLQSVRLFHDDASQQIRIEIIRHLFEVRLGEWFWAQQEDLDLSGFVVNGQDVRHRQRFRRVRHEDDYLLEDLVGDIGWDGAQFVLLDKVAQFTLQYFDNQNGWRSSWDSRELIIETLTGTRRGDEGFNAPEDEHVREKGLPTAIALTIDLTNGERLVTYIDIPASSLNDMSARDARRGLGRPASAAKPQAAPPAPGNTGSSPPGTGANPINPFASPPGESFTAVPR